MTYEAKGSSSAGNGWPLFDMDEVRDIIFDWLDLLVEHHKDFDKNDDGLSRIAAVVPDLKLAADKSSYLGRRFAGEVHRTEPCPKHQGRWSGLPWLGNECKCDLTGWLPRAVIPLRKP